MLTTDYAYTANRLVSGTGAEPAAYTYDNVGNITSDGTRDFVYNQNNRLVRVEAGGTVLAEYAYDGFERRVKKVAGGVTTHYHYDLNGRLIAETDGAGNPIRDYVYIDGEPVAMQVYGAGTGWYWFLNDHLGTPQKLVDHEGAFLKSIWDKENKLGDHMLMITVWPMPGAAGPASKSSRGYKRKQMRPAMVFMAGQQPVLNL